MTTTCMLASAVWSGSSSRDAILDSWVGAHATHCPEPRLRDEREQGQGLCSIDTVARCRAARRWKHALSFVEPKRLPAYAALGRDVKRYFESVGPSARARVDGLRGEGQRVTVCG